MYRKTIDHTKNCLRILFLGIATATMVSSSVLGQALAPEQRDLYRNTVYRFDYAYEEGATGCEAGGSVTLVGRDNSEKAFNYFKSKGLSEAQAAAIVGNLQAESGVDPEIVQLSGYGHGIAQWETQKIVDGEKRGSGRWDIIPNRDGKPANVKSFAASAAGNGRSMTDLSLQLDFLWHELTNFYSGTLDKIKASTTAGEAAIIFMIEFEAPADRSPTGTNARRRADMAKKVLDDYGTGAPTAGEVDCAAAGGTIVQVAVGLAWPERFEDANPKQPGRTYPVTPTPAYVEAVKRFNPTKVGSASIDCGVFVATVMHMSGADAKYPDGGTSVQFNYLVAHSEKYQRINNPARADLQPGDILIITAGQRGSRVGHTWIYAGKQSNGETDVSASLDSRAPNFGSQDLDGYTLFRRVQ